MTKHFLICLLVYLTHISFAQKTKTNLQKQKPVSASFPYGKDSLKKFFDANVQYLSRSCSGCLMSASITINANGAIDKIELIKSSDNSHNDSLFINVIKKMPKWTPATNELGNNCSEKQLISYRTRYLVGVKPVKK